MRSLKPEQITQIHQLTDGKDTFDSIIAFGYGPVQKGFSTESYKLSVYGRINAIATGMLYQSHAITRIIPTGGQTGGHDKPSEAYLMARFIQSRFNVPDSSFILEEQATDTIFNIVHVANLIDESPQLYERLLFVALGCHLPRIQAICALVGLNGAFVAAEAIAKLRSERHKQVLLKLLHPKNSNYARLLADQARGLRGLQEIPEYWFPPMGCLKSPHRLRNVLENPKIQSLIVNHQINRACDGIGNLQTAISSIERKFP